MEGYSSDSGGGGAASDRYRHGSRFGGAARGHLGALVTVVPFELVDTVLEQTRSVQRLRALPSQVGVYFLLAMCLFPEVGYRRAASD